MDSVVRSELDLIGSIYDAALDPGLWNDTVERIRRHLSLAMGAMTIIYLPRGVSILATANIPPEYLPVMVESGDATLDLWGGPAMLARIPLEEPLRMQDRTPPESWTGNQYYERFGRPQGLVDQLALVLEYNSSMVASLSMGVHESMPPVHEGQIETYRMLAPHLRRAVLIGNLLEARSVAASTFESALDALGSAVLLVDAGLHIVYANPRAEAMLQNGDPIAQRNGRLDVPRELVPGQVERTVGAAALPGETIGPASGIPVRRKDGAGSIVHILPLERRADRPRTRAVAAVFVAEPNDDINLPLEGIRALYDLRPAEARVLQLIASGLSGRAVADALGVSQSTAKTHTVRLFDKLGVHTRAELVRFARDMSLDL